MRTVIGYARSALTGSSLSQQRVALLKAGCEAIFEEVCSGMSPLKERPALMGLIQDLCPGDTLAVCDRARLSRSFVAFSSILSDLQARGVELRVLHGAPTAQFQHLCDLGTNVRSRDIRRGIARAKKTREQAA